jgi:hypothetical protein
MEKRYQVFLSSTYKDLIEERSEVMKVLIKWGAFPAGMELFPASDESIWELITSMIDSSDYYLLLIAGRYGSMSTKTMSYTEKEYRYALKKKIPCIVLIHKNPGAIPSNKTDMDDKLRGALNKFRAYAQKKSSACGYWENLKELSEAVLFGLRRLEETRPAIGWVRAKAPLNEPFPNAPADNFNFGGELTISFVVKDDYKTHVVTQSGIFPPPFSYDRKIFISWEEIFRHIGLKMYANCSERGLLSALKKLCHVKDRDWISVHLPPGAAFKFLFKDEYLQEIKLKFLQMNLIEPHPNSLPDVTSWRLTEMGKKYFH